MALALQDQSQAGSDMTERVRLLLQGMEDDLERGVLPLTIYNNPEIHRLELRGIFARSWIFVAHESEIPSPGDYVQRYIGHDPWIVVRGDDGQVRVLFDSCRHRALSCAAPTAATRRSSCARTTAGRTRTPAP